jgi:hypothetical protein
MPKMPKVVDLQTSHTSPLLADNPPQVRTRSEALLDEARDMLATRPHVGTMSIVPFLVRAEAHAPERSPLEEAQLKAKVAAWVPKVGPAGWLLEQRMRDA